MQANFSEKKILRPEVTDTTAYGVALGALVSRGEIKISELGKLWKLEKEFSSRTDKLKTDIKTLKEKEFPNVKIDLMNFKREKENYSCDLTLNLVGKQKLFKNLPLKFEKKQLNGIVSIKFSDFNLVPPTRMMGMVKVSEVVELNLALRFATDR